ncbi:MAG TPA: EthD domain-containing protein [Burkholderiales bacterium]|nr:EthD domain-containing protein [Burkholderiales bacterium]
MFKVIRMVKRKDKTPAEFRQEWLERNRDLRKTANRLVASVVADGKILGYEPPYDGVAALYFPGEKEARDLAEKNQGKDSITLVADEKVLFEKPGATLKSMGQLKVMLTAVRRQDLSPAQFKDASLKGYAKVDFKTLSDTPIQKIVASFAVPEKGKEPAFDGMLEIYFASPEDIVATFGSPVIGALRKDEDTLVRLDAPEIRIVSEEHVL